MEEAFPLEIGIQIAFPTQKTADIVVQAILPELNPLHEKDSHTQLKANKNSVSFVISAKEEKRLFGSTESLIKNLAFVQKIQSTKKEL